MNQALLDELTNDPAGLGYAPHIASENDAAILALLTDKTLFTRLGWISSSKLNLWSAKFNDEYRTVEIRAADPLDPMYGAANALKRALNRDTDSNALNLGDPDVSSLLDAWTFADATGVSKAALIALGTHPASRAEVLGLSVTAQDIANALRP